MTTYDLPDDILEIYKDKYCIKCDIKNIKLIDISDFINNYVCIKCGKFF